ncbi:MAG: hypothetical protein B6U69_00730 [Thermofilum sp. ex4484_15]|nr:MAG: hypothetical protein B6U69_00730 [Thermofilum sp. ex4484_15]
MREYREFLNKVLRRVRGEVLSRLNPYFFREVGKGAGGDSTLMIDKVAEELILENIRSAFPNSTVVSEESGVVEVGKGGPPFVIVDPIDGSLNATRDFLKFSISIAIAEGKRLSDVSAGGVMDVRCGDFFEAYRGFGVFVNGKRVKTSKVKQVEEAIISIPITHYAKASKLDILTSLLNVAKRVRNLGSTSLELSYVGAGIFDAFVDLSGRTRNVDIAAAYLIVKEGGGVILSGEMEELDGRVDTITDLSVLAASSSELANSIFSLIKGVKLS